MAVSTTVQMADQLYVPYHQEGRGEGNGLVGTLHVDAEATGAAGGGTVTVSLAMSREEFGFPLVFVPTYISAQDNLAAAEEVRLTYNGENPRLSSSLADAILLVRTAATNQGVFNNASIPIEGNNIASGIVIQMQWITNTDTKVYHMHLFGPVFDLQVIAKNGFVDPMMAGLR